MTKIINSKQKNLGNVIKIQKEYYKEIPYDLALILEGQKINQKDLRLCFIKLATQKNELRESNKKLNERLDRVLVELNELRHQKLSRKKARVNRKRLITLCLLVITGTLINELLPLKVYELKTIPTESWIKINRSKHGPSGYKAYLSK